MRCPWSWLVSTRCVPLKLALHPIPVSTRCVPLKLDFPTPNTSKYSMRALEACRTCPIECSRSCSVGDQFRTSIRLDQRWSDAKLFGDINCPAQGSSKSSLLAMSLLIWIYICVQAGYIENSEKCSRIEAWVKGGSCPLHLIPLSIYGFA